MTAAELRSILQTAGLPAALWQLADATYEPVSSEWVLANWRAWLDARPAELVQWRTVGGGKRVRYRPLWLADSSDCDNLALGVVVHGQVGNALRALGSGPRGGLAFGVMFYLASSHVTGPHAINWSVDHDHAVRFFEPGLGLFVELSPAERSSAWFGLAA